MRFRISRAVIAATLMIASFPAIALADDGSPAQAGSDYDVSEVKVPKLNLKVEPGKIDVRPAQAEFAIGSSGQSGSALNKWRLKTDLHKDFVIGEKTKDESEVSAEGLLLTPGLHLKLEGMRGPDGKQKIDKLDADIDLIDPYGGRYIELANGVPTLTAEGTLLRTGAVIRKQDDAGKDIKAVKLDAMALGVHKAWKVNGLPIDICGGIAAGVLIGATKYLSESDKGNGALQATANFCAGVGVGKVGHIGYGIRGTGETELGGDKHVGASEGMLSQAISFRTIKNHVEIGLTHDFDRTAVDHLNDNGDSDGTIAKKTDSRWGLQVGVAY
jgi:hypothetical protein